MSNGWPKRPREQLLARGAPRSDDTTLSFDAGLISLVDDRFKNDETSAGLIMTAIQKIRRQRRGVIFVASRRRPLLRQHEETIKKKSRE
jgi:hypothetical protein